MSSKEILEFTKSNSESGEHMKPIIDSFIKDNPDVAFETINDDEEPDMRRAIGVSMSPAITPCYVGIVDGKINKIASGEISKEELSSLIN